MAAMIAIRVLASLGVALAGAYLCRRRSAALRHFVLASGVVAAPGVAAARGPDAGVDGGGPRLLPGAGRACLRRTRRPRRRRRRLAWPCRHRPPSRRRRRHQHDRSGAGWRRGRRVVWLAGAVAVGLWLVAGLIGLRRATARTAPLDDARWLALRDAVAAELGVRRTVGLRIGHSTVGTWGTFRPRIVLPPEALGWSDDCARAVLAHELAHVRRHDFAVLLASTVLCAVHWFNPLAWIVAGRLRDEGERACDDIVLDTGIGSDAYATHLLDIARGSRGPVLAAAMAMARPSTLEGRITAMLNPAIDRRLPSLPVPPRGRSRCCSWPRRPGPFASSPSRRARCRCRARSSIRAVACCRPWRWRSSTSRACDGRTPTDGEGRFEFAPVGAGKYVLEASIPGFRTLRQDIVLEQAKDWSKNITLQVGELQETISVRRAPAAQARRGAGAGRDWQPGARRRQHQGAGEGLQRQPGLSRVDAGGRPRGRREARRADCHRWDRRVGARPERAGPPRIRQGGVSGRAAVAVHSDAAERRAGGGGDDRVDSLQPVRLTQATSRAGRTCKASCRR